MDATFVSTRLATGLYAKGQQVAVFLGDAGEFELSRLDVLTRRNNRTKYKQDTAEEDNALATLGDGDG